MWGQLLNIAFSFLRAMCILWPGFIPISVSCRYAIDVVWLGFVCCARLTRTLITVCSATIHLLLLEFNIPELKYQGVERHNLLGISCLLRFDCGMTFPTLCLTPECWIGSRVQSTVGCFPELCFLQFSVGQVLVRSRKKFTKTLFFPLLPVLLLLIIIIEYINNIFGGFHLVQC